MLMVSCIGIDLSSLSESSLSKKEALLYITETNGTQTDSFTIPEKLTSVKDMGNYCSMELLNLYAQKGLVEVRDSTVSYRTWGGTKSYEAVEVRLTTLGAESLIEHTQKGAHLLRYKYDFDKIVDMEVLARKNDEDIKAEIVIYAVYYTGTVIEATPFITTFDIGIDVESKYPFSLDDEDYVRATTMVAIFRDGELVSLDDSDTKNIKKSEMEEYSNDAWLEILEKRNYFMR